MPGRVTDIQNSTSLLMSGTTAMNATEVDVKLHSPVNRIVLACVWILASVLGIAGNSLVIGSVCLSRKVRTVTNAFVVNLSVADLWASLSYPWEVVAFLSDDGWPLRSEVPCVLASVQLYTGLAASLYTLAMIALNRFVLVTRSRRTYQRCYSRGKVAAMIAGVWAVSFLVYLFPLAVGIGAIGYDAEGTTCSDIDAHERGEEYNLAQSLGFYPVPMAVIICSYLALYVHVKRHFGEQKRKTRSAGPFGSSAAAESNASITEDGLVGPGDVKVFTVEGASCASSPMQSGGFDPQEKIHRECRAISRRQVAITKNLFVVFCIFTLLISPYFIALAVPTSRSFALYGLTISILNSCVNPIIYTINHPTFKVVLRKMITCRFSEIPEPSDLLKYLLSRRA